MGVPASTGISRAALTCACVIRVQASPAAEAVADQRMAAMPMMLKRIGRPRCASGTGKSRVTITLMIKFFKQFVRVINDEVLFLIGGFRL